MDMETTYPNRETWLLAAAKLLEQRIFEPAGYSLPRFRISVGWPTGNRTKVVGQCHPKDGSKDQVYEIFISPKIDDPVIVLAVIIHELSHAVAGLKAAHKKPFIAVMSAVGMVKKWTNSMAGEELQVVLREMAAKLGPYPHASLTIQKKEGRKGSRLIKLQCPSCDYIIRATRIHLDEKGPPICPVHNVAFQEEKPEDV